MRNLPQGTSLTAYTYETGWGYYTGHSNLLREEFAEKYYIDGATTVVGVISHHTGINTNDNIAEFNVYEVSTSKLPGSILGTKEVAYKDIDLSGESMTTFFDEPIGVKDSFYVSFNLKDYAHGGYAGDTIAVLSGEDGSRTEEDLALYGRNAIRYHNHGTRLWRDFYTQNFTPVATHFAIFPIVEFKDGPVTGIKDKLVSHNQLTLYPPFPNPALSEVSVRYFLTKKSNVTINLLSLSGEILYTDNTGNLVSGEYIQKIDTNSLSSGVYIVTIQSGITKLAARVVVN
ncbi:hypothetical protein GCM10011506_45260 [Marivirga lumbricoides]|uniref:Secretion system C-terminal sorting domain-containing protein n=1 Tax=Marivirga lumbricoides TaxID=1046115 RepID=A0ABQ1N9U4_9BACT|nr:hypothetical protein GCM10011506_45260 [Marivirga lumbricoides]